MAKQLVNPFERHVEKAVLGITGLLLIGTIVKYLVTTPNQVELPGVDQPVTANNVDEILGRKADAVRQTLASQQPKVEEVVPVAESFIKAVVPLSSAGLGKEVAAALPIGPEVPFVDPMGIISDRISLVSVAPVPKPHVTSGRLLTSEGEGPEIGTDWVTVSTIFDLAGQAELQTKTYGSRWRGVLAVPAQLQRREVLPNGSWSDWTDVVSWPAALVPNAPNIPLEQQGKQIVVPKDDIKNVEKFVETIERPRLQLEFLRPQPPPESGERTWKFPVITTLRDVAVQEDYYLFPDQEKSPNPYLTRFEWLETATHEKKVEKDLSPQEQNRQKLDDAQKFLQTADKNNDEQDALRANNLAVEVKISPFSSLEQKTKADRLIKEAEEKVSVIRIRKKQMGGEPPKKDDEGPKKVKRDPEPKQQIWAHDAKPGSLVGGKTYQYRIRPVVFNRLAGFADKFKDPANAQVVFIPGEWSEPSDPVNIEPTAQLFLAAGDPGRKEATFEMYQWFRGIWVSARPKVKIGESIALEDRKDVPSPDDPKKAIKFPVLFATDGMLLDIDFKRPARERKVEKNGIRFMPPGPSSVALFVSSDGRLHEYVEVFDKTDPARTMYRNRLWKPQKP